MGLLSRLYAAMLDWQFLLQHPRATAAARLVLKEPAFRAGDDVVLYMTYAREGCFFPRVAGQLNAWMGQGFEVVLVIAVDDLSLFDPAQIPPGVSAVMLRQNAGFDFAAWASAFAQWPALRKAGLLALANDSCYGPLAGFDLMLQRVRSESADVVGCTVSSSYCEHLQSFLLFFRPRVLLHRGFERFWRSVRCLGKTDVIERYELGLTRMLDQCGFSRVALFDLSGHGLPAHRNPFINPTVQGWKQLLQAGLPFIKVQLLRDRLPGVDLSGWDQAVADGGYSLRVIRQESDDHARLTGRPYHCYEVNATNAARRVRGVQSLRSATARNV